MKQGDEVPHNHLIDKIAFLNAVLSAVALYPQLYTILILPHEMRADLSIVSFGLVFANSLVWFWYGYHRKILPLMISSLLNAIASGGILFLIHG